MRKKYVTPIIEKVSFDYRMQLMTASPQNCFGSVVNVTDGDNICHSGTPSYIGWNSKHPGDF